MDIERLREYCLAKPGVEETFPFDAETLVFKVMGKMFALIPLERGNMVSLKCDPERAIDLREEWEEIQAAWHMNKKHWNQVDLNGRVPATLVTEMVDHSYALVVKGLKKALREQLKQIGK